MSKKLLIRLTILSMSCFLEVWFWGAFLKWIQNLIKINNLALVMVAYLQNSLVLIEVCVKETQSLNSLIKLNHNIKVLDIYGRNFLYTAYADNNSFFFKKKKQL